MNSFNRRKFLGQIAATLGVGALAPLASHASWMEKASGKFKKPIGFQTFPIRDLLGKDMSGTLKTMADMGYQTVEMCSPAGYAAIGFGTMTKMSGADIKKTIEDAGLSCPSCHFGFGELKNNLDDRIAFAKDLGLSAMICSTFWLPANATIDDYKKACADLNRAAEKIKAAGMQAGFHNHDMEFAEIKGVLIYDALMEAFDPKLVKMQFQTEVINKGYKAATYFRKYPGRFIASHLSDWTAEKKYAPIGQGVIDWKEFASAADVGGVKYLFVEMEPMETYKPSAEFLHKLLG